MFGMKGIGENGAIGPPASIVNAVNDALRPIGAVRLLRRLITARRVREAIACARIRSDCHEARGNLLTRAPPRYEGALSQLCIHPR